MSDDRLKQILSVRPSEDDVTLRSARARKWAIASYRPDPQRGWWHRSVAAAALASLLLVAWTVQEPTDSVSPDANGNRPRMEMKLQLSDGTQVTWVIDERYAL